MIEKNLYKINANAFAAVINGENAFAQELFRDNAKKFPCCLTLNNLGVYYYQYGSVTKNGMLRSAKILGRRYLEKAAGYEINQQNCMSLASAYYEAGNPDKSEEYILKANTISENAVNKYDLAVCRYQKKDYVSAMEIIDELTSADIAEIVKEGGDHAVIIQAYCHWEMGDLTRCRECVNLYRKENPFDFRLDVFALKYLCGMYEDALSECMELLREWYPTNYILGMIADCVDKVSSTAYCIEENLFDDRLMIFYKMMKDKNFRLTEIKKYKYVPPFISQFLFIT